MLRTQTADGTHEVHWDSITEMYHTGCTFQHSMQRGFHGDYGSLAEIYQASMRSSKYVDKIRMVSANLASLVAASIPDQQDTLDVTGLDYDMGLLMSGSPECWISRQPSREPKIVRILIDLASSAMTKDNIRLARGIGLCALLQCLELAGIGVDLAVVTEGSVNGRVHQRHYTQIKAAGEYFDLERFSFALCDTAFDRGLGFSLLYSLAGLGDTGSIMWPPMRVSDRHKGEYDIIFDRLFGLDPEFQTAETTKRWVTDQCRRFGVEIR